MKALTLLLLLATPAFAKIRVVATLPSFADIAQKVGGSAVEVTALTKGTQDPHFVDAKPDLMLTLNRADMLLHAGLGLEDGWLPSLVTGARNGKIQKGAEGNVDVSTLVMLKDVPKAAVDRSMGDVHPGGNPHYMLDPRNGIAVARGLAVRLGKLEPATAAAFTKRAEEYCTELTQKIKEWEKALAPSKGKPVVTYHKSWIYFLEWAGLHEVGNVEPKPGIPPSPDHVAKLVTLMKEKKVVFVLIEPFYPRASADSVAQAAGASVRVLPTEVKGVNGVDTYTAVFDTIVNGLK